MAQATSALRNFCVSITIEDKTEELKTIKADGVKKRETQDAQIEKKEKLESDFKEATWTKVYKKYETSFKEAFVGSLNKENFKSKILLEFSNNTASLETVENLKEKANTIFGEIPQSIPSISQVSFERTTEIETNAIWKKIVVGKW